ncbi:hypothetical protein C0995_013880 [Termitomyces sp. Mi166|nr:hypothetical protein C0995_013880 [Termitomyces sp. Mi166\
MAPPQADLLSKRSTIDSNIILIIILVIIMGALVITAAIILFVVLKRTRSVSRHSRNLSDSSAVSLLRQKPQWREESFAPPLDHARISSNMIHHNDSTDSLATILPPKSEPVEIQSREATPLLSSDLRPPKPILPPLSIPSYVPSRPEQSAAASSQGSASSESLYSQPSASASHIATPSERKPPLPRLLPPVVPQYAHIRPDTTDVLMRADTRMIGKLLKERAKRNERKPTRSVSRIERAGSIKPLFDFDDSDEDSESMNRPRRSKIKNSSAVVPGPAAHIE